MDTAQWPQEMVFKPMEEMVPNQKGPNSNANANINANTIERKVRPHKEQVVNCPRCNSTNTKFCYYNNYSLTQPRYFCKTCRRYWTEGGSLRNIPVGGGSRKNKRSSSPSLPSKKVNLLLPPQNPNHKFHDSPQDLNLGANNFPSTHDFKTISDLIRVPNFDANKNNNSTTSTHHLHQFSALELLNGITTSKGLNSFMPMPISDPNSIYSSGLISLPEFKPTLNFSLDGTGTGTGGYGGLHENDDNSNNGRLLFPFEDLKQGSSSNNVVDQNRDQHGDSSGYWSGTLAGGSW